MGTYGPRYQQLARAPAAPEASARSSLELDAIADQTISACGGDARKTVKGLIAANDFIGRSGWKSKGGGIERLAVGFRSSARSRMPREEGPAVLLFVLPN